MSKEERFEIQIQETRDLVLRMDRQIDLVERLLAEKESSLQVIHGDFTNSIGMEMVWCPPGTFWMGSPEDEEGHSENETLHEVTLTHGFWIGKHPVTQRQWQEVMGDNPSLCKTSGPNAPVDYVNWYDAQAFCQTLSNRDGRKYRLPTEAEWEYSCRAGTTSAWCFGDNHDELEKFAWNEKNRKNLTNPVGQKKPNAWGIHDMHGNVDEWCHDWFGNYPTEAVIDPAGPSSGDCRVNRGSCINGAQFRRSAYRTGDGPGRRACFRGFRVTITTKKPETECPDIHSNEAVS